MAISFSYSSDEYKVFDEDVIRKWICVVIEKENYKVGEINYEFVSDDEILKINQEYLNHNYYTDIITFDEVFVNIINGDIIVSFDTVLSNAQNIENLFISELNRVIIHGIMHLCGYKDKTVEEKKFMRALEDKYLTYLEKL